jgi:hypothetical protein
MPETVSTQWNSLTRLFSKMAVRGVKTGIAATELPLHVQLGLKLAGPLCAAI